jgi:hypothetical protein
MPWLRLLAHKSEGLSPDKGHSPGKSGCYRRGTATAAHPRAKPILRIEPSRICFYLLRFTIHDDWILHVARRSTCVFRQGLARVRLCLKLSSSILPVCTFIQSAIRNPRFEIPLCPFLFAVCASLFSPQFAIRIPYCPLFSMPSATSRRRPSPSRRDLFLDRTSLSGHSFSTDCGA